MSSRDQAILRRMMADVQSGGHTKQAGVNDLETLMAHALGNLNKTAAEDGEKSEEEKKEKDKKSPPPMPPGEGEGEEEDEETKEVLASIGRAFVNQYGYEDPHMAKVAAAAFAADQEFMTKAAASACADEMAKIAYATGAGMTFEEYMEKVSGIGSALRSAGGAIAGGARSAGGAIAGAGRSVGGAIANTAGKVNQRMGRTFGYGKGDLAAREAIGAQSRELRQLARKRGDSAGVTGARKTRAEANENLTKAQRRNRLIAGGLGIGALGAGTGAALAGGDDEE